MGARLSSLSQWLRSQTTLVDKHASALAATRLGVPIRSWIVIGSLFLLLFCTALWATSVIARRAALQQLLNRDNQDLQLYVANIRRDLYRYRYLPRLLARDYRMKALLAHPDQVAERAAVNQYLELAAGVSGAEEIYLIAPSGLTLAASNWRKSKSFVGENYGFRPYFKQAMQGVLGHYYAVGVSTQRRGYFFAYPVREQAKIIGVLVVKVPLASLENNDGNSQYDFVVTDPSGVIFLSTRAAWRYHTLSPLTPAEHKQIEQAQRYAGRKLTPLSITRRQPFNDEATLLSIGSSDHKSDYIAYSVDMPAAGWRVHIFSNAANIEADVFHTLLLTALGLSALFLISLIFIQRRHHDATLKRDHDMLEERVAERTADLLDTNQRLVHEIARHQRTEAELRRARGELVQTAKLATIGQLSAGINHEINQPLTAIRFYAGNALVFLERSQLSALRDNLVQINSLTDRIGRTVTELKLFARKSSGHKVTVSISAVLDGALTLLASRLQAENAELVKRLPHEDLLCLGNTVLLEQVFVNLIGNALQSMADCSIKCVEISARAHGEYVQVDIRDFGTGIPAVNLSQIFDPFFTTKDAGTGLGLGLSISLRIIEDLAGRMRAANHPQGGAVFTVELPVAPSSD